MGNQYRIMNHETGKFMRGQKRKIMTMKNFIFFIAGYVTALVVGWIIP